MSSPREMHLREFPGWRNALGGELTEATPEHVVIRCSVTSKLLGPTGVVHRGVYSSLIEEAASIGAALWLGDRGHVVGVSNVTHGIRDVDQGVLEVTANPVSQEDAQQLWRAEVAENGRLLATGEVRLLHVNLADI